MKKKTDYSYYVMFFFILAVISLAIFVSPSNMMSKDVSTPTGNINIQFKENPAIYAKTLKNWVQDFYGTNGVKFPKSYCTDIAKEFLTDNLNRPLQVTEEFTTTGEQRVSSLMFGIGQEFAGVIEMVDGNDLIDDPGMDFALNFWIETVIRLPHLERTSGIEVTTYGKKINNILHVKKGKVITPMIECVFSTLPDGTADCVCKTGRTHSYINE